MANERPNLGPRAREAARLRPTMPHQYGVPLACLITISCIHTIVIGSSLVVTHHAANSSGNYT